MCRGNCVLNPEYTRISVMDDFAWSLYVLDLMVWLYFFLISLYVIALFIWSIVLWAAVALMMIFAAVAACCAACMAGGGECLSGCGDCSSCSCNCGDCGNGCCLDCCFGVHHGGGGPVDADMMFWSGPFPSDPFWGYGGYGHVDLSPITYNQNTSDGSCCDCRPFCLPIAWLFYVFPLIPENAWGGILGFFVMGTHQHTPTSRMYSGGNAIIEFLRMGWRRRADLHEDDNWRDRVYSFIMSDSVTETSGGGSPEHIDSPPSQTTGLLVDGAVVRIGNSRVQCIDRPFEKERDGCFESSFEDYQSRKCWICQDSNDQWDLWVSCRHLFCSRCSTQMLQRRMPCPLCRTASSTVLRGVACHSDPADIMLTPSNSEASIEDLTRPILPSPGFGGASPPRVSSIQHDPAERFINAGVPPRSTSSTSGAQQQLSSRAAAAAAAAAAALAAAAAAAAASARGAGSEPGHEQTRHNDDARAGG